MMTEKQIAGIAGRVLLGHSAAQRQVYRMGTSSGVFEYVSIYPNDMVLWAHVMCEIS